MNLKGNIIKIISCPDNILLLGMLLIGQVTIKFRSIPEIIDEFGYTISMLMIGCGVLLVAYSIRKIK